MSEIAHVVFSLFVLCLHFKFCSQCYVYFPLVYSDLYLLWCIWCHFLAPTYPAPMYLALYLAPMYPARTYPVPYPAPTYTRRWTQWETWWGFHYIIFMSFGLLTTWTREWISEAHFCGVPEVLTFLRTSENSHKSEINSHKNQWWVFSFFACTSISFPVPTVYNSDVEFCKILNWQILY